MTLTSRDLHLHRRFNRNLPAALSQSRHPHSFTFTSTSTSKAINTMKLYPNIERIDRQLKLAHFGYSPDQDLSQETLSPIDSMHYLNNDAIQAAIGLLRVLPGIDDEDNNGRDGIDIDAQVVDVGSGILGGSA